MSYSYSSSMFIGDTTRGLSQPVFFDLHTPVVNNKPPGCLVTGAPGSGKTFFALTLTTMNAILGKTTIVLDPKGDFLNLINLENEIGGMDIIDLAQGKPGILDPFYLATDSGDKLSLVIELIDLFLGGLTPDDITALSPIVQDVINSDVPSLQKVLDELRRSQNNTARNLGTQLDLISKMKFSKLCFAPGAGVRDSISINRGLTIITMPGLEFPKGGEAGATRQEKLGGGILFLITDFLRRVMHNDNSPNPKTIVIDEAHAVISSEVGARTIKNLALLGRSKYLALVLVTQNNSHISRLDIDNTISSRFAFKSDQGEGSDIIASMGLPVGESFEDIITNLNMGECLFSDFTKRYATVQISAWRSDWKEAFNTNPMIRLRREREKRLAAQQAAQGQGKAPKRPGK